LKVLTTASISDAQLIVSDTADAQDTNSATKYSVEAGKTLDKAVDVEEFQTLIFNYKLRNQAGKALAVQQAFLKISNKNNEFIAVSKISGKSMTSQISMRDLREHFLAEAGTYNLEIIVGDSFVHNPVQFKIASLNVKYSNETRYEVEPSPFSPKPEIVHMFRPAETRPDASVSFAFTIACLAPILIFLIGLLRVGANAGNFPSGVASMYALAFQGCIGAILALFALYWFKLNMMQTLNYLLLLSVPTLFFGVKTLNAVAAQSAPKPKRE